MSTASLPPGEAGRNRNHEPHQRCLSAQLRVTSLPTETVGGDDRSVPLHVVVPDVVEEATTATYQLEQATTAVVVLLVDLEVLVEVVDPLGQQRNLHLGRAGVGVVKTVLRDDAGLLTIDDLGQSVSFLGIGPGSSARCAQPGAVCPLGHGGQA